MTKSFSQKELEKITAEAERLKQNYPYSEEDVKETLKDLGIERDYQDAALNKYNGKSKELSTIVKNKSSIKLKIFNKKQLKNMRLNLGDFRDVKLSLTERIRLWTNKNLVDGGTGCGDGYACIKCGSDKMEYFKREFELKSASWDVSDSVVVPPINKAIKLPDKVFYLFGKCNYCDEEQQVSNNPNTVTYWG